MSLHLVQISDGRERRVAKVEDDKLFLLSDAESVYQLAKRAVQQATSIAKQIEQHEVELEVEYEPVYQGESQWRLLAPIDVPGQPEKCMVSGTGLTHLGSAKSRQAMHAAQIESMTDSMKMFQWGVEGGNPGKGKVGIAPEWFYKGNGTVLCAHLDSLEIPFFGEDGGEEAELAAIYIVDDHGVPFRLGFTTGNEFSDHVFEKRNYLNLAGSKLRQCSIGPELVITNDFTHVTGKVSIIREGKELWSESIETGESAMSHSLQNLEHHHFKFKNHQVPSDIHVHFLGAAALSFSSNITLQQDDWMQIAFDGFGRPLRNSLHIEPPPTEKMVLVQSLA